MFRLADAGVVMLEPASRYPTHKSMRMIGHVADEARARVLSDYLVAQGIPNELEREDHHWAVWIRSEEDVERARGLLSAFQANPENPSYRDVARLGAARRLQEEAEERQARERLRSVRDLVRAASGPGPLTIILIGLCIVVQLLSHWDPEVIRHLQISERRFQLGSATTPFLPEVRQGQVWRLLTPAFVHAGLLHIFFNMLWLWDLGNMIERRQSAGRLALLVAVTGVLSNLGQYLASGPRFGGMSGVVYGLLGYAWMMGRYRPEAGLVLHPQTVVMMLVWFAVCLSGVTQMPIANTAHGVGLVVGVIWGRIAAAVWR